jgi:tetratricopeptide (TPR) repeat protein
MQNTNFYALFGLADCYRGMNMPGRSLEYWNRILENDPLNKLILTRAGDAWRILGRRDEASRCYRKAMGIEFDLYAALGLALIAKSEGKTEAALDSLMELVRMEPANHRFRVKAAECLADLGRTGEAVEILKEFAALEGNPNRRIPEYLPKLQGDPGEEIRG